ncbi:hypothetical protein ACK8QS_22270 (plasmid) [Ectopseudomonas mendocina]
MTTITLPDCAATAFAAEGITLICLPAAGAEPPAAPGEPITLNAAAPYGKTRQLGTAKVTSVMRARLESISDNDILAAGFPNWTRFSADWTTLHGAKGFAWDVDPEAWFIRIEVAA